MGTFLDKFREWMDSPEGEKAMEEFANELALRDELTRKYVSIIADRVSKLSDEELDQWFQKIFQWEDGFEERYYQRGVITQSNILSYIRDAWGELGKTIEVDSDFADTGSRYRNYTFVLICGQGCFTRIYKGEEIIYQTN